MDYTAWPSWDWYGRLNIFVAVSGEGNDVQVLHAMKEHFKEPKNRFPLTFRTWTLTRKEFEIPWPLVILTYHKVKKIVMLWGQMAFWRMAFEKHFLLICGWTATRNSNPRKTMPQNTWYPFLRPTSWGRIFSFCWTCNRARGARMKSVMTWDWKCQWFNRTQFG